MTDLTHEHLETFVFDPHRAAEQEVVAMARELLAARARATRATEKLMDRRSRINGLELDLDHARAEVGLARGDADAARQWAAWFAAEAAYWKTEADLYHTVAAQNYENDGITVASLDAERTELQARIAELSDGQGDLIRKLSKASARVAELERVVEVQVFEIADKGEAITRLRELARNRRHRIAELEAAQANPDAYIAVKRYHSPNADGPEWDGEAVVFPAEDPNGFRAALEWSKYEFLPIVADGDRTRFAATPPTRCQATTASPLIDDRRSLWCELPAGHVGMHHAAVPQPGFPATEVDWDDTVEASQ